MRKAALIYNPNAGRNRERRVAIIDAAAAMLWKRGIEATLTPTRAAGKNPIKTVGQHGGMIGPPTWGTTPVTIGHVCMSVSLAAGGIFLFLFDFVVLHQIKTTAPLYCVA